MSLIHFDSGQSPFSHSPSSGTACHLVKRQCHHFLRFLMISVIFSHFLRSFPGGLHREQTQMLRLTLAGQVWHLFRLCRLSQPWRDQTRPPCHCKEFVIPFSTRKACQKYCSTYVMVDVMVSSKLMMNKRAPEFVEAACVTLIDHSFLIGRSAFAGCPQFGFRCWGAKSKPENGCKNIAVHPPWPSSSCLLRVATSLYRPFY